MIGTTESVTVIQILELAVIPALLILFGMFVKQGREIQALKTAAASRPDNCAARGRWISKLDRRVGDTEKCVAVLKERVDSHIREDL
jgi:hypothetical protein